MKDNFPITGILKLLEKEDNSVFLESARRDEQNFLSYIFLRPKEIISTRSLNEINACFAQLNKALKAGFYTAGFLSYEAGQAFEERLRKEEVSGFPLLWFGIYEKPLIYDHRKAQFATCCDKTRAFLKEITPVQNKKPESYLLRDIRPNICESAYLKAIKRIKDFITRGFTYQVNYTFKLEFSFSGSAQALYLNLRNNQSVPYSAFIKTKQHYVLSFSPELFFRKKGNRICARPMKGTIKRGKDLDGDKQNIEQLRNCPKNRSENVMIVDLLRNDLGRISTTGSVKVPQLFNVERYETLFQMTSDIESRLKPRHFAFDMFSHIFPSGSVTGAPKIKTVQIISQLENQPRKVYTGSIGFFSPEGYGTFNVAIRTLLIDRQKKSGEMGVGSGIVYDSDPKQEFAECCLKANFLIKKPDDFRLIETMLWQADSGYLLLDKHLKRLEDSARYFSFVYNRRSISKALIKLENNFAGDNYKVRLLLSKEGEIKLEPSLLKSAAQQQPKICFSAKRTQSMWPLLYHKTTYRRLYDEEYKRCRRLGFYDVVFANEKGEITEGAISNIFVRKNGRLYTPPLICGLLNGVYRRYLLETKKPAVKERVLFKNDLLRADEIYLSNSVRGLVRVYLESKNH